MAKTIIYSSSYGFPTQIRAPLYYFAESHFHESLEDGWIFDALRMLIQANPECSIAIPYHINLDDPRLADCSIVTNRSGILIKDTYEWKDMVTITAASIGVIMVWIPAHMHDPGLRSRIYDLAQQSALAKREQWQQYQKVHLLKSQVKNLSGVDKDIKKEEICRENAIMSRYNLVVGIDPEYRGFSTIRYDIDQCHHDLPTFPITTTLKETVRRALTLGAGICSLMEGSGHLKMASGIEAKYTAMDLDRGKTIYKRR